MSVEFIAVTFCGIRLTPIVMKILAERDAKKEVSQKTNRVMGWDILHPINTYNDDVEIFVDILSGVTPANCFLFIRESLQKIGRKDERLVKSMIPHQDHWNDIIRRVENDFYIHLPLPRFFLAMELW